MMPGHRGSRVSRWVGHDWFIAAALFTGTVVSRIPFRTTMLYAWDSVLYARAIDHFDIRLHHPQPPGHIFYVGLVWLVNRVVHEPNAAMVWISVFFAAASVASLYWLGKTMFNRDAGLVAALLLATSLSFWSLSEAAYPYTLLAFLSVVLAGVIFRIWEGSTAWVLPAGLLLGLASGFRQDLLPFLLPLLALAVWNKGRWRAAGAALLLAAGIAAWYIPSALLSGGFGPYREASSEQSDYLFTYFSVFGRGAAAIAANLYAMGHFLLFALAAALALVPVGLALMASSQTRGRLRDRRLLFLAVWMLPSLLFYIFIHIGEFGYVFSSLPAILLLGAWGLQIFADRLAGGGAGIKARRIMWGFAGTMVVVNLLLFLVLSPPLSANRLAARDDILRSKIDTIKENFDPKTTFIVAVFDYQQTTYYLTGFQGWAFDPSVDQNPSTRLPEGTDTVIIFEEYLSAADPGALTLPLDRDQTLIYLRPADRKSVRVDWDARKVYLETE
jgi:hypothetical protein